jgi:hypothetical protein
MSRSTELKARLDELDNQIGVLQNERRIVLDELNECVDTSLTERFYIWSSNADVHLENFRELEYECPVLAKHVGSDEWFNRHQTYDLTDETYFVESIDPIFEATDEERKIMMTTMPDYEMWFTIGMEIMQRNLKSFKFDW